MTLEIDREWPGFTQEGYKMYETATQQIRNALACGHTYDQACETLHGLTADARAFISDDFLKIIVAEEHLGSGKEMDDLALALGIPYERIETAMISLLHELNRATVSPPVPAFPAMVSTTTH